jgi:hypothetical protein
MTHEGTTVRRVGITGHVDVSEENARWIIDALTLRLQDAVGQGWQGITCLARGADQLFAKAVLALKGSYDVVLPAADYEQRMIADGEGQPFADLLARANGVQTMPYPTSSRRAYLAASEAMLSRCDLLLAVWDGRPSRRMGDTADVVERAQALKIPVTVIWPPGAARGAGEAPAGAVTPAAARGPG